MAEIRVEQKGSSKWMYYVAAAIVIIAAWLLWSRQDERGANGQTVGDSRYQDSVSATTPPAAAAVPRDSMVPPR